MNKALFSIVDNAMDGLVQTKEMNDLFSGDPYVQDVSHRLGKILDNLKALDLNLWREVDSITGELEAAYTDCGVFYGLQIAEAFRAVASNPLEFSRYVHNQRQENKKTLADVGGDSDLD